MVSDFPGTVEVPHFEKISYRVNHKIFATLSEKNHLVTLKLSEVDQDVFSIFDTSAIYPVPNKWGKQGWTFVDLDQVREEILRDALSAAYDNVAPKKTTNPLKGENQG